MKTENQDSLFTSVLPVDNSRNISAMASRRGKYSGKGYQNLNSPPTQAERWNMPFADPEFEYDPKSQK